MSEKNENGVVLGLVRFDRVFFLVAPLVQYGLLVFGLIWANSIAETRTGPYFNFSGLERLISFFYFLGWAGIAVVITFVWHCISFWIIQQRYKPHWRETHGKVLFILGAVAAGIMMSFSVPMLDLLGLILAVPLLIFMHVWGWMYKFISDRDVREMK